MTETTRGTRETTISVRDAEEATVNTGWPFFTHMLEALCCHGMLQLSIEAKSDGDRHHLVEDTGFVIGAHMKKRTQDNPVQRAGCFTYPMDDALAQAAVDISGRPYCVWRVDPGETLIDGTGILTFREFFTGFARGAGAAVHIRLIHGEDAHHSIEAVFKAFGRAIREATAPSKKLMSTKGVIDD